MDGPKKAISAGVISDEKINAPDREAKSTDPVPPFPEEAVTFDIPRLQLRIIELPPSKRKFLLPKKSYLAIYASTVLILLFCPFPGTNKQKASQAQTSGLPPGGAAQMKAIVYPERLQIPGIQLDADVEHLGINSRGEMEVPDNTVNAGWFEFGPSPGEKGSAVISGHFNSRIGQPGVFNNLDKLKPGDKIMVTNNLGKTSTFVVRESRHLKPGFAEEVFSPKDDGTHLNLVTCDGFWNTDKKSYSKRLVVFADKN